MDVTIARERLASVVKPDSITYSQGDFLATHVAIKRLRLMNKFDVAPSEGREDSEKRYIENSSSTKRTSINSSLYTGKAARENRI